MGARFAGKDVLIEALRKQQGYAIPKATKVVEDFLKILKRALRQHKNIVLEGIGTLRIVKRNNAKVRYKEVNLKYVGPTIVSRHPKKYEIHFKRAAHWEKEDE